MHQITENNKQFEFPYITNDLIGQLKKEPEICSTALNTLNLYIALKGKKNGVGCRSTSVVWKSKIPIPYWIAKTFPITLLGKDTSNENNKT